MAASRAGAETPRRRSRIVDSTRRGRRASTSSGLTGDDADQVLVAQPGQQLHEQERAAVRALDEVEQRVVGLGVDDVLGHLGDGVVVERAEDDPLGAGVLEILDRAAGAAPSPGPGGRRRSRRPAGRRGGRAAPAAPPRSRCRPTAGRRARSAAAAERGSLEHRLQVLQQPVPLLGQRVQLAPRSLEQRLEPSNSAVISGASSTTLSTGLGRAGCRPGTRAGARPAPPPPAAGSCPCPAPFDQHHRAGARPHAVELNTDRGELGIPAADRRSRNRRRRRFHRPSLRRTHTTDLSDDHVTKARRAHGGRS